MFFNYYLIERARIEGTFLTRTISMVRNEIQLSSPVIGKCTLTKYQRNVSSAVCNLQLKINLLLAEQHYQGQFTVELDESHYQKHMAPTCIPFNQSSLQCFMYFHWII